MEEYDFSWFDNPVHIPYHVDVVILIDATGSMDRFFWQNKKAIFNIVSTIQERMDELGKSLDSLRIKVISFRDFAYDAEEDAIMESPFFSMPEQEREFTDCINRIEARGGGIPPENSLEAICLAMRSAWNIKDAGKRRHVILLFTDAPAVPIDDDSEPRGCLRKRKDNPYYPKDIPTKWEEFELWWNGEDKRGMPEQRAKRMILFAPADETWERIASTFDNVWHVIVKDNNGCDEYDIDLACEIIACCC